MRAFAWIPHALGPKGILVVLGVVRHVLEHEDSSLRLFSFLALHLFQLFCQFNSCLVFILLHGYPWLGCQDLPAVGVVSF